MRDYKVLVSPKAKEMLDEYIDFLAQVNAASARNKKNEIMKVLRSLSDMPARFPLFESDYIKLSYFKYYLIISWSGKNDKKNFCFTFVFCYYIVGLR